MWQLAGLRSIATLKAALTPLSAQERSFSIPQIADQNTATGAGALLFNNSGTDNTGNGAFALHTNATGSQNTASGVNALHNNDSDAAGLGNNNTAVGAAALEFNVDGSENTAVGAGAGPNLISGFNNTYVGDFVDTLSGDESNNPNRRHLERKRRRVLSLLHRWYLQQLPACWRHRC
jgi:hypothetical protein